MSEARRHPYSGEAPVLIQSPESPSELTRAYAFYYQRKVFGGDPVCVVDAIQRYREAKGIRMPSAEDNAQWLSDLSRAHRRQQTGMEVMS